MTNNHSARILDQFTRQATPFSTAGTITDAASLRLIVETSSAAIWLAAAAW
jgi:hypothetical protein